MLGVQIEERMEGLDVLSYSTTGYFVNEKLKF